MSGFAPIFLEGPFPCAPGYSNVRITFVFHTKWDSLPQWKEPHPVPAPPHNSPTHTLEAGLPAAMTFTLAEGGEDLRDPHQGREVTTSFKKAPLGVSSGTVGKNLPAKPGYESSIPGPERATRPTSQLLKPMCLVPRACNKSSHHNKKPIYCT